ncbi:MAG: D-alanyl-D-alanine carboxypeptidase, partial [Clostridia bacterium]
DLMNTKAHELGLENTHFVNPHGLPAENHYTTALELAKITQIAMKNQTFKTIVSTQKTTVCGRLFVNHNKLLFDFDGICGVKTGFTKSAGRCLVTAAQRNGVSLIAVTLNGPSCSQDHKNLLNFGFSYLSSVCLSQKGSIDYQIAVTGGNKLFCHVTNSKSIDISVPQGTTTTTVVSRSKIIYAPIKKGDILGEIKYYSKNKLVASTPLAATEDITIKKINLFNKLFD